MVRVVRMQIIQRIALERADALFGEAEAFLVLTAESGAVSGRGGGSHSEVLAGLRLGVLAREVHVDHFDAHASEVFVVGAARAAGHARALAFVGGSGGESVGDHF